MLYISKFISAFQNTNLQNKILVLIVCSFAAFAVTKYAFNEAQCTRYCTSVEPLPSERVYFSGIDHYEDRFPERVKRFRELKKAEQNF